MSPQRQLRWANIWTAVGLLPFALVLCWETAFFATFTPNQQPIIPMIDPIGMIGLNLMSFVFMLAIAGPQLWWAWRLTSYHDDLRSNTTLVLRIAAVVLLLSPWLMSWILSARHR